jgi:hypothetical protein
MSKDKYEKELKSFQEKLDEMVDEVINKNKKDDNEQKDQSNEDKESIDAEQKSSVISVDPVDILSQLTKIIDITKNMVETEEFKQLPKEKQFLILKQLNLLKEASKELEKEVEKDKEKFKKEEIDRELTKAAKETKELERPAGGILDALMPKGIKELESKIGNKGKYGKILKCLKKNNMEQSRDNHAPDHTPNRRSAELQKNIDFVVSPILKKQ